MVRVQDTDASDAPLSSDDVTAGTLRDGVIAARSARGMNRTGLQRASGLSARTLRDIEMGNQRRRYDATTLGRLDGPLGWAAGTAWDLWRRDQQATDPLTQSVAAQIAALERRLEELEETPPWAAELIDAVRLLLPEDRDLVLALARRLHRG